MHARPLTRPLILDGDIFPASGLAIDANYTPWKPLFLQQMKNHGFQTLNGFSHMLGSTLLHLSKISGNEISYSEMKNHLNSIDQ